MKVSTPSKLSPFFNYAQEHNKKQQRLISCGALTLLLLLLSLLGVPESYVPLGYVFYTPFALAACASGCMLLLIIQHQQFKTRFAHFRSDTKSHASTFKTLAHAVHYRFSGIEAYLCNRPHRLSTKAVELFEMARCISTVLTRRSEQVNYLACSNRMSDVVRAHSLLSAPLRLEENAYSPLIFLDLDKEDDSEALDPILQDLFDRLLYEVSQEAALPC